jgi:hypothetical protein
MNDVRLGVLFQLCKVYWGNVSHDEVFSDRKRELMWKKRKGFNYVQSSPIN